MRIAFHERSDPLHRAGQALSAGLEAADELVVIHGGQPEGTGAHAGARAVGVDF